jgi:predicted amidohydrolase
MTDLRVAALCYCYAGERRDNLKTIARLFPMVGAADIVLLPEDSVDPDGTEGETVPGPFTDWLQDMAAFHGITLIANLVEQTEEGRFDTCCIIDHTGKMTGKYRKIQLSHSDIQRRGLTPGQTPSVFKWNNICFGVSICYDTWYPEIIRMQALQGAQIIFAPFKEEFQFISRVRSLVSARSVENLIWMVCTGGGGAGAGISYHPFAWIVSPSGEIVRESGNEEFIVYKLRDIEKTREREKALKNWNRPFDTQFGDIRRKDPQIQNKKTVRSQ